MPRSLEKLSGSSARVRGRHLWSALVPTCRIWWPLTPGVPPATGDAARHVRRIERAEICRQVPAGIGTLWDAGDVARYLKPARATPTEQPRQPIYRAFAQRSRLASIH